MTDYLLNSIKTTEKLLFKFLRQDTKSLELDEKNLNFP